jgi:hypothetical protein
MATTREVALASLSVRVGVTRVLLPLVVAVIASAGVSLARHNPDMGAGIVAVVATVAVACALIGERGAALAAIGVGAAASFPVPGGLAPLLVLTGVIVTGDIGLVDRRVARWRYVLDAIVSLPALGGLAATIAAQPSHRAVALGGAAAAGVGITLWRNRTTSTARYAGSPVSFLAAAAAVVVVLVPDRLRALGAMPPATVTAARSVAAGLAVFVLALVVDALWAERQAAR